MLLVVFLVVVAPFERGVESDNVPEIDVGSVGFGAIGDALQFFAIFLVDVRPYHVLRRIAEERPVLLVIVLRFKLKDGKHVLDFLREQIAVLVADLVGRALKVDEGPAVLSRRAEAALEFVGLRRSREDQKENGEDEDSKSAHRITPRVSGWILTKWLRRRLPAVTGGGRRREQT